MCHLGAGNKAASDNTFNTEEGRTPEGILFRKLKESVTGIRTNVKVIRKFFFKTITKVLDGISGITKNIFFFHLKAYERRNFDFCVFLRMCSGSGGRH